MCGGRGDRLRALAPFHLECARCGDDMQRAAAGAADAALPPALCDPQSWWLNFLFLFIHTMMGVPPQQEGLFVFLRAQGAPAFVYLFYVF